MANKQEFGALSRRQLVGMTAALAVGCAVPKGLARAAKPLPRIIDFRARPNTSEYLALFAGSGGSFPKPEPLAQFIKALDKAGIGQAVFPGRQSSIWMNGRWAEVSLSNDYVAGCVAAYPDRLIGLAGINPVKRMDALREIERAVSVLGMKGVSVDLPGVQADDRMMYPIYYKCLELNVPIVITQGPRMGNLSSPRAISTVAEDLPDLKIICSHAIYPQIDEWIALVFRNQNVYLEASMYHFMPGANEIFAAANTVVSDKIIYGSAFPFSSLNDVELFKSRIGDPKILDKILFKNAATVLGFLPTRRG